MMLIVVPAAVVIFILAYSLYSAALSELSASQANAAAERARMVGDWFDAAGRALSSEAAAAGLIAPSQCGLLAQSFLERNPGVIAVRFLEGSATDCSAGPSHEIGDFDATVAAKSAGGEGYRTVILGTQVYIVSAAPRTTTADPSGSALLIDPDALQRQLRPSDDVGDARIALIDASGAELAADPASADRRWLPSAIPKALDNNWRATDRGGKDAAFAMAPVPGSSLNLLMRFDDRRRGQARRQLVVLSLAQVAMLALLAFFYAGTIRRDIVRWIVGLDAAARARGGDPESRAKAPVANNMPSELRSVAESFNAMADHVVEHQVALKTSLDQNRVLMLEMHHRIKNSLQVIQSYLALIRRSAPRAEAATLTRIEARVSVIAVAYRRRRAYDRSRSSHSWRKSAARRSRRCAGRASASSTRSIGAARCSSIAPFRSGLASWKRLSSPSMHRMQVISACFCRKPMTGSSSSGSSRIRRRVRHWRRERSSLASQIRSAQRFCRLQSGKSRCGGLRRDGGAWASTPRKRRAWMPALRINYNHNFAVRRL